MITHRAELELKMDSEKIKHIYNHYKAQSHELFFEGYKVYWNDRDFPISIYINKKTNPHIISTPQDEYELFKKGADRVIKHLRKFL